ncbi:hypothetical protein KUTeg_013461 [Tegillarca granosa]|uniref:Pecanex-like protein n=1 Tax=Tegillarca granosa TaxID=220873 RepID=A0ABQ9ETS5_TEGGR|nr:hypothetical protein KUTeg_013461 [Tegillarca granosa]
MGSHIIDIFRQGIWASLTGGWFYDPHQNIFSNTFHLYLWMGLLAFPLVLHLTLETSLIIWVIYCSVITVAFIIIKAFNYRLHHVFDTSEVIEETVDDKNSKDGDKDSSKAPDLSNKNSNSEAIELKPIRQSSTIELEERVSLRSLDVINNNEDRMEKGIVLRSESNRSKDGSDNGRRKAPLAELEADGMDRPKSAKSSKRSSSKLGKDSLEKKDIKNADEIDGKILPQACNQITTKVDIEQKPDLSDGEVEICPIELPARLREETDSDLSPEGEPNVWRRRKAVRRTKSVLEESEEYDQKDLAQNVLSMSLPPDARYHFNAMRDRERNAQMLRPRSAQNITRHRVIDSNRELTTEEEPRRPQKRRSPVRPKVQSARARLLDMDRNQPERSQGKVRQNRSLSVDENLLSFRPRIPTPHVGALAVEKKRFQEKLQKSNNTKKEEDTKKDIIEDEKLVSKMDSQNFNKNNSVSETGVPTDNVEETGATGESQLDSSHSSDISFGEFIIDDMIVDTKDDKKTKLESHSSNVSSSSSSSSQTLGKKEVKDVKPEEKLKDKNLLAITNKDAKKLQDNTSQQSSTVGLDWLFHSDTDSLTSGDDPKTMNVNYYSVKMGWKDNLIHTISESVRPRERYLSDTSSTMTNEGESAFDTSPEHIEGARPLSKCKETPSTSKSSGKDELEVMRKQGAIPKTYPSRPLPALPSSNHHDDISEQQSGSPSSGELSDREDFRKKILEILSDPSDNPEQMKKLFKAVIEAKGNRRTMSSGRRRMTDIDEPRSSNRKQPGESSKDYRSTSTPHRTEDRERSLDSKSNTPTESSALLPAMNIVTGIRSTRPRTHTRFRNGRKSRLRRRNVNQHELGPSQPPPAPTTAGSTGSSFHVARSHEDTTEGAVHWFQDESDPVVNWTEDRWSTSSSGSGSTMRYSIVEDSPSLQDRKVNSLLNDIEPPGFVDGHNLANSLLYGCNMVQCDSSTDSDTPYSKEKPKHFYNFEIFPKKFLKIRFDRLALLALLDRNLTIIENAVSVIMAVFVGALGALVLSSGFYYDFWSVQPDASSPTHGYNRLVVFSRPFYFCVCCGLMLLLHYAQGYVPATPTYVYGMPFTMAFIINILQGSSQSQD